MNTREIAYYNKDGVKVLVNFFEIYIREKDSKYYTSNIDGKRYYLINISEVNKNFLLHNLTYFPKIIDNFYIKNRVSNFLLVDYFEKYSIRNYINDTYRENSFISVKEIFQIVLILIDIFNSSKAYNLNPTTDLDNIYMNLSIKDNNYNIPFFIIRYDNYQNGFMIKLHVLMTNLFMYNKNEYLNDNQKMIYLKDIFDFAYNQTDKEILWFKGLIENFLNDILI